MNFDGVRKRNEPEAPTLEPQKEIAPINALPQDVLIHTFLLLAQLDITSAGRCARICKRWREVLRYPLIQQLFVAKKFPHLMTDANISPSYFTLAMDFSIQLNALSFAFGKAKKSILVYSEYLRNLKAALNKPDDFFATLPYFDLRPLGWLRPQDWQSLFLSVVPKLKNVRILLVSEIGTNIDFNKLKKLQIPIAGKVLKVTKTISEVVVGGFFPAMSEETHRLRVANELCFCIGAIAATSRQLTTLIADNTPLSADQFRVIFSNFGSISKARVGYCLEYDLSDQYPHINFRDEPKVN